MAGGGREQRRSDGVQQQVEIDDLGERLRVHNLGKLTPAQRAKLTERRANIACRADPEEVKLKDVTVQLLQKAVANPTDEFANKSSVAACDRDGLQHANVSRKMQNGILLECEKYLPAVKANLEKMKAQ
jgi:hypothetical protein